MLNTICICINIDREEDLLLILGIVKSTQESSRSETQSRESWRPFFLFLFFKAFAFYVFTQLCLIQFRLRGKDDEVFKTYYIRGCAEKRLQPLGNTVADGSYSTNDSA